MKKNKYIKTAPCPVCGNDIRIKVGYHRCEFCNQQYSFFNGLLKETRED